MDKTSEPAPTAPASKLDRLFDRGKFRRRTLKFYRVAGPVVLAYFALSLLHSAGLFGSLSADDLPRWLMMLYAVLTFGVAIITPVLFVLASVGAMALKSDWRFAVPLWTFAFSAGLFLVTVFFVRQMTLADQQQVWNVATALLVVSAAWATAVGYRRKG
jgi:hypothetical protein